MGSLDLQVFQDHKESQEDVELMDILEREDYQVIKWLICSSSYFMFKWSNTDIPLCINFHR